MQKSCSADKSTMYVDNIRQSSERMREMLNTLLDFFRLDNGKEQPNLSPCRISAITHILETEFMPIAMNKGLTLIVESHTDAVVLTDKERILQIGNNLLSNAIRYSPENGRVVIGARQTDDGFIEMFVRDFGKGIDPRYHKSIFDHYFRVPGTKVHGRGSGLSISRDFGAAHNGTLTVDSKLGEGSTFVMRLKA